MEALSGTNVTTKKSAQRVVRSGLYLLFILHRLLPYLLSLMSLSFSLPSLLGERAPVARRVAIPTARGAPRTAAASEMRARARPRVWPGRGSVPAQGLQVRFDFCFVLLSRI